MKILLQDGTEEGPVRKCDLKSTTVWLKTDMCARDTWRMTALKVDQREVPLSKHRDLRSSSTDGDMCCFNIVVPVLYCW